MLLLCDTERHRQRRRSDRQAEYLDIDRLLVLCIQGKAYKEGACRSFADGLWYAGNGNLGIDKFQFNEQEMMIAYENPMNYLGYGKRWALRLLLRLSA